jgi:hypothetical protein
LTDIPGWPRTSAGKPVVFGRPAGEVPRPRPHDVPSSEVRARFFCTRHGQQAWHLVALVTKDGFLVTTDAETPYPSTTREVPATCDRCERPLGALQIEHVRLRQAVDAPRRGRVLREDVDRVARRVADTFRP